MYQPTKTATYQTIQMLQAIFPWHILLAEDDVRQSPAVDAHHHRGAGEQTRRGLQLQLAAEGHEVQRCRG